MMDLLIGAPVRNRGWIIDKWFDHVLIASLECEITPRFIFLRGTSVDDTNEVLERRVGQYDHEFIDFDNEPSIGGDGVRCWEVGRLQYMADLRNEILAHVRGSQPTLFLSLDSDILINTKTIKNLIESAKHFDAVGGRCYMTPKGVSCPSYGKLDRSTDFVRGTDFEGIGRVGTIMAIKMMNPKAYNVDYEFSHLGEDIGWSKAAREAGCVLGWDGRTKNKHVMCQDMLDVIDNRVGY